VRAARLAALLMGAVALAGCGGGTGPDPFAALRLGGNDGPLAARRAGGSGGDIAGPARGFTRIAPAPRDTTGPIVEGDAFGAGPGVFTVNFEDADLREVVRTMIEDGLGASYVIDPRVEGTVTLRTNEPLAQEQILPVLEEILALNDAAVVERAGVLQVVPRDAVGLAPPQLGARAARARGLTLRVTPLANLDVEAAQSVLGAFEPVDGRLAFDAERGLVFSVATSAEQRTIAELLRLLDQPALAGQSMTLKVLRNAQAEEVAAELQAAYGEGAGLRVVPVTRLGAVLLISRSARRLGEADALVSALDQDSGRVPRLHVFDVENRRASELAPILSGIFGVGGGGSPALAPSEAPAIDGEAEAVEVALAPSPTDGGPSEIERLSVDESSNAILVFATAEGARQVGHVLRRLDVQAQQVQLEATLAEVTLTRDLEYGVRAAFERGDVSGRFSDDRRGRLDRVDPGFNTVFRTENVRVTLSALDNLTDVKVLSSPTLMVRDGEPARLQIGDQVPVTTRSSQSVQDPDAPILQETEFRDTGVILSVLPRINANGLVSLEIRQEVSDVQEGSDEFGNPTFSQRVVESTVLVDSGDTIAIAGLIRDGVQRSRLGLPILGARGRERSRTELIVLITPRVVRDQGAARAATDELRGRLGSIFGAPVR
jgi:general secretion pathway protein D